MKKRKAEERPKIDEEFEEATEGEEIEGKDKLKSKCYAYLPFYTPAHLYKTSKFLY